jgi:hypothetical protein
MQHKAAKCIRIAQSMLGHKASVAAIEDQALDLMNLSDRQIQAALARLAMQPMAGMPEMLANMTLTPDVGPMAEGMDDEALLAEMLEVEAGPQDLVMSDDMMVLDEPMMAAHFASKKAEEPKPEEIEAEADKAEKKAAQLRAVASKLRAAKKAEEAEEPKAEDEGDAAKKATHFKRLAAFWAKKAAAGSPAPYDQMPGSQNAPEHYNFRSEGVLAAAKAAKKAEEPESDAEAEALLEKMEAEEAEKPAEKKAKKAEEPAEESDAEAEEGADKAASYLAGDGDPMADLMDDGDFTTDEELASLYAMKQAKKADEDEEEGDEEEIEETEEEVEVASKKAALRPQPRKASNGVRSLGAVSKVASSEVNDLAKLWESAPDVSKIFG